MTYVYQVKSNAGNHNVPTDKHHSNYDDASFKRHLQDILKGVVGSAAAGIIIHEYKLLRGG